MTLEMVPIKLRLFTGSFWRVRLGLVLAAERLWTTHLHGVTSQQSFHGAF